mgnify:CR=1 FL=1|jgi:hypothetical protein|tara:strand:- start:233 stop:481 length:249 start_codon:yes stop_codon:yes gene_type:complete
MTDKINEIKSRLKKLKKSGPDHKTYHVLQSRLRLMIKEHGLECVSAATGLTEKTIQQYARVSVAPAMSKATIDRAEIVLEGL